MTGSEIVLVGEADGPLPPRLGPPAGRLGRVERYLSGWTPLDAVAALLTGAHLVALLVLLALGSLLIDDLRAQGYAEGQPFGPFLVGSNGTHFAPLPRVLDWLQAHYLPLHHQPAVAVTLVVRLLLAVAFWRLLRRVFGPRPAILVPFTVLLFTPVLLGATAWYRQSITVLACTVALVWALDAHVRYHLERRRADLLAVTVATTTAVGLYEKGALLPGLLLATSVLLFTRGRRPAQWWRSFRPGLPPLVACGSVVAGFVLIYRSGPYDQGSTSGVTLLQLVELAGRTVGGSVAPGLLGIGWQLSYPAPYLGVPVVSAPWLVLTAVAAAALLVPAVLRAPQRVLRAVLFGAAWVVGSVTLVAIGRFQALGLYLADQQRLWPDLVPALVLSTTLAVLPWRFQRRSERPEPFGQRSRHARSGGAGAARRGARAVPSVAAAATLLMLAGSALSWGRFADRWWDNPTGDWVAAARASLDAAEPNPRVVPRPLPEAVMPTWVRAVFPSDRPLVALLRPDARFGDGDGPSKALNSKGVLSRYLPARLAGTAPPKGCLATLSQEQQVDFTTPAIFQFGALVEVALLVDRPTRLVVTLVRTDGSRFAAERWEDPTLPPGPHTVRLPFPPGAVLRGVRLETPGTPRSCVISVQAWVAYTG